MSARRALTTGELGILDEVRRHWGPQNTPDDVFFSDADEAVIFVKARNGSSPVMIVLTNVAAWLADGTFTLEDVRRHVASPDGDSSGPRRIWHFLTRWSRRGV